MSGDQEHKNALADKFNKEMLDEILSTARHNIIKLQIDITNGEYDKALKNLTISQSRILDDQLIIAIEALSRSWGIVHSWGIVVEPTGEELAKSFRMIAGKR